MLPHTYTISLSVAYECSNLLNIAILFIESLVESSECREKEMKEKIFFFKPSKPIFYFKHKSSVNIWIIWKMNKNDNDELNRPRTQHTRIRFFLKEINTTQTNLYKREKQRIK